jgi:hypothetical protein
LPTARQEQAPTDLTSRCAEINVVDLQEKEIGLAAAAITLLLLNCDKAFGDALQVNHQVNFVKSKHISGTLQACSFQQQRPSLQPRAARSWWRYKEA